MKSKENDGRDGSQFDMRDSELQSMGDLYVEIHDYYKSTLNYRDWDSLIGWLNHMRVFNSYLEKYVGEGNKELFQENRDDLLELNKKVGDKIQEQKDLGEMDGPDEELILEMEKVKSDLEELRDAAGFTLPMNQKHNPETVGADQL